eukprot:COSAG05_NODE_3185_length_2260_cov_2.344285_6_plen_43_part_00
MTVISHMFLGFSLNKMGLLVLNCQLYKYGVVGFEIKVQHTAA